MTTNNRAGVAIVGGYGGWNVGDEAILHSLVGLVREAGVEGTVHIICPRMSDKARNDYESMGWRVVTTRQPLELMSCLTRCDLLVGGGQIINGRRPFKSLGFLGLLVVINRIAGRRPCVVGVGVNDIDNWLSKLILRMGLLRASAFACRDRHSLNHVHRADPSKGILTADLVFSGIIRQLVEDPPNRRNIVVSICHSPEFDFPAISVDGYIRMVRKLTTAVPGHEIWVVAHDNRDRFDAGIVEPIRRGLHDQTHVHVEVLSDLNQTLAVYAGARLVVGQRMHPLIIGNVLGSEVVPIQGSSKVAALSERLGWPTLAVGQDGFLDEDELDSKLNISTLQAEPRLRNEAYSNIAVIRQAWGLESPCKPTTQAVEVG